MSAAMEPTGLVKYDQALFALRAAATVDEAKQIRDQAAALRVYARQRNDVDMERGQHSAKPERIRDLIHKASPGPRLELFARRAVEGWTCWGNEIRREVFAA